ncbi:MAG: hypothetical protein UT86_C0001G0196 [Candidatus Magasanikbacteria bacterium GW2011_GWC2_40_17]|uniref:Uncharacterized protein n=1 Tax=Candidatus Magasanikbacteria bacterium GW2011_GWA2_42_32 TaxID=1619039 RepID=A0A0G1CG65_9BACT|nr:MAG: hypothetical protein UT86_C0001G0196 [Candidatus Magasanikbacteria bacterium GW2011_GWC2_40_17]KKS57556.1 MAG: hypothetical protein UV20_C0001G0196 [Candidatus Magasanikbacteria bacterium GW2011_GWA2_42_32]OGH85432.1 MAG: hypothetical protein A2294_03435 [Candidatus Magasanikbacteria bacterium RIFOXYB2_FULL_38_10]
MGQLIKLKTNVIKPSQDFLKKGTVNFILDCYKKGEMDSLPPTPIVRKHPNVPGVYVAIDGHNLLAVNEFLGIDSEVYLVNSADDYLPNPTTKESISQRNQDLVDKYESSVFEADKINRSFKELIKDFIA